jgi:hypothetical protein
MADIPAKVSIIPFCAPDWIRTSNLQFSRPLLYPIELQGPQNKTPEALTSFRRFSDDNP